MITEKERLRFTELAQESGDRAKIECFGNEIKKIFDHWSNAPTARSAQWWQTVTLLISALDIAETWCEKLQEEPTQ